MSVVKSPMGLMVGFMLIVVFLMPKLMENMGMLLKIYMLTFFILRVSFLHVSLYGYTCFVWVKFFISLWRSLGLILSQLLLLCLTTSKYQNQVEISEVPSIFLPVSILKEIFSPLIFLYY